MHGFLPPHRYFAYLSWTDVRDMPDKAEVVLIQPVGAIEQHGPHLPLAVDSAIATGVIGRALAGLDPTIPAYALPPQYVGKSNEHCRFPGTLSLSAETLGRVLTETALGLYKAGFRKLVFANAHGGQPQVLEIVARDLREHCPDFQIFPWFIWNVPHTVGELLAPRERREGIHAGDAETSVLLALLPEQVQMQRSKAEYPDAFAADSLLSLEEQLPVAWLTHEISMSGVVGDPTPATAAKGEAILNQLAQGWQAAIAAVHQFPGFTRPEHRS